MTLKIKDEMRLTFYGYRQLNDDKYVEEFFHILSEASQEFIPLKIGIGEPIRTPYSIQEARRMWKEQVNAKRIGSDISFKNKRIWGDIGWNKRDDTVITGITIPRKLAIKNIGIEVIMDLAKKLFLWSNSVIAYVRHASDSVYTPGLTYRICLGGITWLTLFGPPYAKLFSREVLKSAPCVVEEFAEDYFMLVTTPEPVEMNPEVRELQNRVKRHLGEDAFFVKRPPRSYTMEEILAGKDRPSEKGYRSPDLALYERRNTNKNNDEGMVMIINEDGSATTFKVNSINKMN